MTQVESVYEYLCRNYKEDEPIFLSEIKIPGIKDVSLRQQIKRLTEDGKIKRFDTGIYYIPRKSMFRFGSMLSVGDVVAFGEYEQDNNPNNGNEPIEWMVLDKRDGKVLLLSRYALEAVRYHNGYEKVSWETCYLRRWLNNEFYDAAFSNNEKAHIFESFLDNSETELSIRQGFSQGNDTYDKVFVLSPKEMEKYSLVGRRCYGTEHALAAGIGNLGGSGECWGWLRLSRYKTEQYAAREELVVRASSFYYAGNIDDYSGIPTNRGGICPAIWVCLND